MGTPGSGGPAHAPPRHTYRLSDLRKDLPASLVVFLIAVPLSLGIATASGAPVLAGLIAAVVGGLVAGPLGGSRLQVSGPAAGLTIVVAELISQFGWAVTCAITVCAGVLQVLLGACRIGRAALAISPTVVHAMLAGIGVTIVISQVHVLLGGSPVASALHNFRDLPASVMGHHGAATVIGLAVIALLLAWPRLPARVRAVPGPLVAIVLVTVFTSGVDVARVSLPDAPLSAIALPTLPHGEWFPFLLGVFTMTIIASVESLLSAVAVDKLRDGHRSDLNRELVGQGSANIVSGMLGGLPITGVIVRSATNVRAGARTRASATLHGVWVLLFTVLLVDIVERIPLAALAALLVVVGIKLVKLTDIRTARRHGELTVYVVTVAGVVLLNLLEGVLLGFAVALLATLRRIVWARVRVERGPDDASCAVVVEGTLCFLSLPRLSRVLAQVPDGSAVHLELVVDYLDHAAYEHLSAWQRQHESTGGTVVVDEIGGPGPTARRKRTGPAPRWFSPWSHWQGELPVAAAGVPIPRQTRDHVLRPLLDGAREYHRRGAPMLRPHLRKLAAAQQPHAMFLTCADSRIVPNVITTSGPGDLFTLRNVGNLVPGDLSMRAGVLYALDHLHVPTMIICGHSRCGAMTALLSGPENDPIGRWLRWAGPSLRAWREGHPLGRQAAAAGWSEVDQLAMVNVSVQLESLRGMPDVAAAATAGRVRLVGLFFDIPTGTLLMLDETSEHFEPLPGKQVGAVTSDVRPTTS
ncbi:Carbonic anhydrase [Alloactinosynnema sp. L-07]|uniref:SulP family inorganic anion transporter n=1 Tax=Alloactinosynnema sp. L-07 TaxID=1653480 RepID=UPI00065F03C5|nr:SulP family inorganic anion transporter [Alloactinosynnema sp. L-07]CRK58484.1 Carbonic anhydrase [Alloactinosynnema sp. L-07]